MKRLILVAVMAFVVSPVLALPMLPDGTDAYWAISEATNQSDAKVIFENTGTGYTFGMFDKSNAANKLEVFTSSNVAGDQAVVTILGDVPGGISLWSADVTHFVLVDTATFAENNFGFYLTTPQEVTFYSDTLLNPGQIDHMTAGVMNPGSEYQLGWDGVVGGGDQSYDDFVVNVEAVSPIPEPASIFLLTLGGMFLRKRK